MPDSTNDSDDDFILVAMHIQTFGLLNVSQMECGQISKHLKPQSIELKSEKTKKYIPHSCDVDL